LPPEIPDLTLFDEIVFFHDFPENKVAIFLALVSPTTSDGKSNVTIDGYFIGGWC
jgi:hypothetical protein